jgi:hypothetical protein
VNPNSSSSELSMASAKSMLFVLPCACSQMSVAEKKWQKGKGL